jgi:hypothetical protein
MPDPLDSPLLGLKARPHKAQGFTPAYWSKTNRGLKGRPQSPLKEGA